MAKPSEILPENVSFQFLSLRHLHKRVVAEIEARPPAAMGQRRLNRSPLPQSRCMCLSSRPNNGPFYADAHAQEDGGSRHRDHYGT
jgi:hypothetical protein